MAEALETSIQEIKKIHKNAREKNDSTRQRWPMIVLRSPKGWTGPKEVDGLQNEGSFRSHQVPVLVDSEHRGTSALLERWIEKLSARGAFR